MQQSGSTSFYGASRAILAAGPTFMIVLTAAMLYRDRPDPATWDAGSLIYAALILAFSLMFGPFVSCLPIMIGTASMHWLALRSSLFGRRLSWLAMGIAIGTGFAIWIGAMKDSPELAFALVFTCGLSAWLCHSREAA